MQNYNVLTFLTDRILLDNKKNLTWLPHNISLSFSKGMTNATKYYKWQDFNFKNVNFLV